MDKLILEDGVYTTEVPRKSKVEFLKKNPSEIRTPIPGIIVDIRKKIGDRVKPDETVIVLDAMKMENELISTHSGIVEKIFVRTGDKVGKNDMLMKLTMLQNGEEK